MHLVLRVFLLILLFVGMSTPSSYGKAPFDKNQRIVSRQKYKQAEKLLNNQNYSEASVLYEELLKESPRNPNLNFKLGTCYLNMASEKEKSVALLEKAVHYTSSKNNVPIDYYYNLGKAYHTNYKFRKALKVFKDLLQLISFQNVDFREEIKREIEISENGFELMKHPVNISIVNLGNKINTEYAEHSPGVTADESTMIFTSRRNGTGSKIDQDGQYFEDIYISTFENGQWTQPKGIDKLNTIDHDASISVSADGQELYIYKAGYYNKKIQEGGDIYVSRLKGNRWLEPQKLSRTINSPYKETHISVSADGRSMYFTSDRPGGYGGLDVYVVNRLPNGNWGLARNLGPVINTEYDEDGPFIHPDGKTLYFSSRGHKTMGGLDIFKSVNEGGKWTTPENIGYPINSTDDDVYYTPTPDGKRAYFSSYRKGSLGRTDIFLIKTPEEEKKGLFVLKGKVVTTDGEPVGTARITVQRNGEVVGIYNPNSATGKFLFIIEAGQTYDIEVIAEGFRTMRTRLNIPANYGNTENHSVITLLPLALRTHEEEDYKQTKALIDFEKSKIPEVYSEQGDTADIPEIKEFEKEVKPVIEDSVPPKVRPKKVDTTKVPVSKEEYPLPVKDKTDTTTKETSGIVKPPLVVKKKPVIVVKPKKPIQKKPKETKKPIQKKPVVTVEKKPTESLSKLDAELYYTLELAAMKQPEPNRFKDLADVKEQQSKDGLYHYTIGNVKNYKEVLQLKKDLEKKGYKNIKVRLLDHKQELIEETTREGNIYYTIQIMALQVPVELEYFKQLDNVTEFTGKDGVTRYTYLRFTNFNDALRMLDKVIRMGYWDAFIRTVIDDHPVDPKTIYRPDALYTIQVMALREPRNLSFFNDLGQVNQTIGEDGKYRYTYRTYRSKMEALLDLNRVIRKGYWDAFVRVAKRGEVSFTEPVVDHDNYYTIQVMALRKAKTLSYFKDLGEENMKAYRGKDGITRYTYKQFPSRYQASQRLPMVLQKGYWDAFSRKINWYKQH